MIMGAPGTSYWTGSVLVYNTSSDIFAAYVDDDSEVLYGSYLGEYSVPKLVLSLKACSEVIDDQCNVLQCFSPDSDLICDV